jgi:hypothetical protein
MEQEECNKLQTEKFFSNGQLKIFESQVTLLELDGSPSNWVFMVSNNPRSNMPILEQKLSEVVDSNDEDHDIVISFEVEAIRINGEEEEE